MQTRIEYNLDELEELLRGIGGDWVARVGILENKANSPHYKAKTIEVNNKKKRIQTKEESGLTNSEIGVIHELGSETNNIPPRSFLRLPVETKEKDIIIYLKKMKYKTCLKKMDSKYSQIITPK